MNILIHAIDFKPKSGGIAEYTDQVARELKVSGSNITVLSTKREGSEVFDNECQYEVIRYDFYNIWEGNFFLKQLQVLKKILSVIEHYDIDLVISNSFSSVTHLDTLATKFRGLPHYVFTHGLDVAQDFNSKKSPKLLVSYLKRWVKVVLGLKLSTKVFSNSSYTQQIVKNLGLPDSKTAVLNPGISRDFLEEAAKGKPSTAEELKAKLGVIDRKVVLTLGRLEKRKGIDRTIQAIRIVKKEIPEVVYIVAGDGPYRAYLEQMVTDYRLKNYVIFTGFVPEEKKHLYYAIADVFVMPSRRLKSGDVEGFGIVFLEANAHGKPVIGGRSGGVVDAIVHGRTGLLIDPENEKDMADAIALLLTNTKLAQELGKRGRDRVKNHFLWPQTTRELQRELNSLTLETKSFD